jgi:hypothetical protein
MDQALSAQEISDGARGRQFHRIISVFKPGFEFARTPGGMSLAGSQENFLDLQGRLSCLNPRSSGALSKPVETLLLIPLGPLVGGLSADAKLSTESGHRPLTAVEQPDELDSLRHRITRFPAHEQVLLLIKTECYLCARSDV